MNTRRTEKQRQLRQLLGEITDLVDEDLTLVPRSVETACKILQNLKKINEEDTSEDKIKYVEETFVDIKIYNTASNVACKCISKVDYSKKEFSIEEFLTNILSNLENPENVEESLSLLLSQDSNAVDTLTNFVPFYGGLDETPDVPRKVREKKPAQAQEKVVKKGLMKIVEPEEQDTSQVDIPKYIFKVLNDYYKRIGGPVDYYEFLMDTTSFGQSVENIFFMSFLINDGRAILSEIDGDVKVHPNENFSAQTADTLSKTQMVLPFTFDVWQKFDGEGILEKYRRNET